MTPFTVAVTPIYDGDPDAPDATPERIGVRLTFTPPVPVEQLTVELPNSAADDLFGRLGDVLQRR